MKENDFWKERRKNKCWQLKDRGEKMSEGKDIYILWEKRRWNDNFALFVHRCVCLCARERKRKLCKTKKHNGSCRLLLCICVCVCGKVLLFMLIWPEWVSSQNHFPLSLSFSPFSLPASSQVQLEFHYLLLIHVKSGYYLVSIPVPSRPQWSYLFYITFHMHSIYSHVWSYMLKWLVVERLEFFLFPT